MAYRIVSRTTAGGTRYQIQTKLLWLFWVDCQEIDHATVEEAIEVIRRWDEVEAVVWP